MKVIYHLGAHCTDQDRIVSCLTANTDALISEGILAPPPQRYRGLIADIMLKLRHEDVTVDIQDMMMDTVLEAVPTDRLILSHDAFLGVPAHAIGSGAFYPMLGDKIGRMTRLFGAHEVEFFIGVSNPALFIPDVFAKAQEDDFATFLNGSDPMQMRWSEMVTRLKNAAPECKVTVWANEDTPLIWPKLLQTISGHSDDIALSGVYDFYGTLMGAGGVKRMTGYLDKHPPKDAAHFQKIVGAFLEKFGLEDVIETEVDIPGWSDTYVASLSDLYDQDLAVLAGMAEITFLRP